MNSVELDHILFPSEKKKAQAIQLHAELTVLRQVEQLQAHLETTLGLAYFTGLLNGSNEVYIPIGTDESVTMSQIALWQEKILQNHSAQKLTVAFMEADTTTTYFSFTPGLLPPTEVTTRKDLKGQEVELAEDDEFKGEI